MRTWRGSASQWEQPVRRQSEQYDDYRAALARLEAMGLVYPSFESRAEIARLVAARRRRAIGRAIPTARRSIRATRKRCRRSDASGALHAGEPYALAPRYGRGDGARRQTYLG